MICFRWVPSRLVVMFFTILMLAASGGRATAFLAILMVMIIAILMAIPAIGRWTTATIGVAAIEAFVAEDIGFCRVTAAGLAGTGTLAKTLSLALATALFATGTVVIALGMGIDMIAVLGQQALIAGPQGKGIGLRRPGGHRQGKQAGQQTPTQGRGVEVCHRAISWETECGPRGAAVSRLMSDLLTHSASMA